MTHMSTFGFIRIGKYTINAEQILHAYDTTETISGGVYGLRIEFIHKGSLFIEGATNNELVGALEAVKQQQLLARAAY